MTPEQKSALRNIPAISQLLKRADVKQLLTRRSRTIVVAALQQAVDAARNQVLTGQPAEFFEENQLVAVALGHTEQMEAPSLRQVINATGVALHTGLGRAPLSEDALRAVIECSRGYSNLELDLDTHSRGRRADHVADLLTELTRAEAATVVNNNAAATLLILNTIAANRQVIVSRGELIEIGGSYRLPEMMAASGAMLCEVGTTNRTRVADYENAITQETAALMRVHSSNYRIVGFTESAPVTELVALARKTQTVMIYDLGSGLMCSPPQWNLPDEPDVVSAVAAGCDLVCFSGDKLLGGPQAGIIVGRADLIQRIEANPLMRTYRVDKMALAALSATLRAYRDPHRAARTIPALTMLLADLESLKGRASKLCTELQKRLPAERFETIQDYSVAGGGTLPAIEIPTCCVRWMPQCTTVDTALAALRQNDPPVVARASNDALLFDVRTVFEIEEPALRDAIIGIAGSTA